MAYSSTIPKVTLFSLPGELRNMVYKAYFSEVVARKFPRGPCSRTDQMLKACTDLFESDDKVRSESSSIFCFQYLPKLNFIFSPKRLLDWTNHIPREYWPSICGRLHFSVLDETNSPEARDAMRITAISLGFQNLIEMEAALMGGSFGAENKPHIHSLRRYGPTNTSFSDIDHLGGEDLSVFILWTGTGDTFGCVDRWRIILTGRLGKMVQFEELIALFETWTGYQMD